MLLHKSYTAYIQCFKLLAQLFELLVFILVKEEGRGWKSRHCIIVSRLLINLFRCKRP